MNFRIGDEVWVNETSVDGKELKHEWYGKIKSFDERFAPPLAVIEDTNRESSYFGQRFTRALCRLERKE